MFSGGGSFELFEFRIASSVKPSRPRRKDYAYYYDSESGSDFMTHAIHVTRVPCEPLRYLDRLNAYKLPSVGEHVKERFGVEFACPM